MTHPFSVYMARIQTILISGSLAVHHGRIFGHLTQRNLNFVLDNVFLSDIVIFIKGSNALTQRKDASIFLETSSSMSQFFHLLPFIQMPGQGYGLSSFFYPLIYKTQALIRGMQMSMTVAWMLLYLLIQIQGVQVLEKRQKKKFRSKSCIF
jgi:hypothetical protein